MSETVWYIEPLDAHTNKIIATELSEESAGPEKRCYDGKIRTLWRCSHYFITRLERNRTQCSLRYHLFVQRGPFGPIRKWSFEGGRVRRRAA